MAEHIGWDPARIDLLWGRKQAPRRGPKPSLSVDTIARAGIEIADAEGLEALSMQRLAKHLDVGTMSLYTYVPDKASLLEVMIDLAFEGFVPPYDGQQGWRSYLDAAAWAMLSAYHTHPWVLHVYIGGPPIGPNQMAYLESALKSLDGTGLEDEEMLEVVMAITYLVRGAAHIGVGVETTEQASGLGEEEIVRVYNETFRRVLDPQRFPLVLRVMTSTLLAEGEQTEGDPDLGLRFGLERILDGIAARIEARSDT